MNWHDAFAIVDQIVYKDWSITVHPIKPERTLSILPDYLQVILPNYYKGRKWKLSEHMTESELVQTALAACLMAEEHEAREAFTYKGRKPFGPHIDIDALLSICDQESLRMPQQILADANDKR